MKAWSDRDNPPVPTPPVPLLAESLIVRATRLSRSEIEALDRLDRQHRQALIVAWDQLRDATSEPFDHALQLAAGGRAWRAALVSLARLGLVEPDHDYWRVTQTSGAGACRAARFAACALVAPVGTDPDVVERLLRPWEDVIGAAG